jgi:hypothetical protein
VPGSSEALRLLEESGAILGDDHFVYVSGEHGSGWIDKDAVYVHPERTSELGRMLSGFGLGGTGFSRSLCLSGAPAAGRTTSSAPAAAAAQSAAARGGRPVTWANGSGRAVAAA